MSGTLGLTRSIETYQSKWAYETLKYLKPFLLLDVVFLFPLLDSHPSIRYWGKLL